MALRRRRGSGVPEGSRHRASSDERRELARLTRQALPLTPCLSSAVTSAHATSGRTPSARGGDNNLVVYENVIDKHVHEVMSMYAVYAVLKREM